MNVEIAERLAARRKLAGLSQEALAEKLGVSRQAVSKWERSESSPDTDNLIALAKLYGVSLDELLYVDESIEDDVAFEAADRAEARIAKAASGTAQLDGACLDGASAAAGDPSAAAREAGGDGRQNGNRGPFAGPDGVDYEKEGRGHVHIGPDGVRVDDGRDHVLVSWADGVHVRDRHGQEVHVGWDGVRVNTTEPGASDHIFSRGPSFEDIDSDFAKQWLKFPFWGVVVCLYLLLGLVSGAWWQGLFLLFLIPVYYIVGAAIASKRVAPMLCALYPVGATAWFFWMAFIAGQWHPAWAIFLTIPIVEVLIVKTSERWHRQRSGDLEGDLA